MFWQGSVNSSGLLVSQRTREYLLLWTECEECCRIKYEARAPPWHQPPVLSPAVQESSETGCATWDKTHKIYQHKIQIQKADLSKYCVFLYHSSSYWPGSFRGKFACSPRVCLGFLRVLLPRWIRDFKVTVNVVVNSRLSLWLHP